MRVDRVGRVTIYKRGPSYWVYCRENRQTIRRRIDGNLATARAAASRVNVALEEARPSPLAFTRRSVVGLVDEYLAHCKTVRALSPKTLARYGAALDHLVEFVQDRPGLDRLDRVTEHTVEGFVGHMRRKNRPRRGAGRGPRRPYAAWREPRGFRGKGHTFPPSVASVWVEGCPCLIAARPAAK